MERKSNLTHPTSVEIILIPNAEKVEEAMKLAAPGYRRALIKKLKSQAVESQKPGA